MAYECEHMWTLGGYVEVPRDGGGVHFQRGAVAALRHGMPQPPHTSAGLALLARAPY